MTMRDEIERLKEINSRIIGEKLDLQEKLQDALEELRVYKESAKGLKNLLELASGKSHFDL